jgi:flagellin
MPASRSRRQRCHHAHQQGSGWTSGKASLDVTSTSAATTTVAAVDSLLKNVEATNATLGAGQNQLQSAVNNMTNTSTNLSAAKSRIMDADYSAESTAMAKAQILSQASTAMIAQANQSQQNVLAAEVSQPSLAKRPGLPSEGSAGPFLTI